MAMPLFLPRRGASQQPQGGPLRIGGGNPLARGLVSYMPLTGKSYADSVDGAAWALAVGTGPAVFDVASRGIGLRAAGTTAACVTRPIPAAISSSATQPLTMRYRLLFHNAAPVTSILTWASSFGDGTPRCFVTLSGGALSLFIGGAYRFTIAMQAEREYVVTHTFDGTTHNVYLNGALVGTIAVGWAGNSAAFYLGRGFNPTVAAQDFLLSDFAVWNRALSLQEVVSDAQNPWQVFPAPQRMLMVASSAGSDATATPSGVSANVAVGTPSASGSASITPLGVLASAAVGTATASAGTSANAAPNGVAATVSVGSPVAQGGAGVTAAGIQASTAIGTASANGSAAVAATGIAASAAIGTAQGSGSAAAAPVGVSASASVGTATASSTGVGTAAPAGVSASARVGTASGSGTASASPAGVAATITVGQVIAAGTIIINANAQPLGVTAFGRTGIATASASSGGSPIDATNVSPKYTVVFEGMKPITNFEGGRHVVAFEGCGTRDVCRTVRF